MAVTAGGVGTAFGLFGSAVSDLFAAQGDEITAQGDWTAATDYLKAKQIALTNEDITQTSTDIQMAQTQRKVEQTIGTEKATTAGNNLEGGSSEDLLRMSTEQGALATAVVAAQGAINKNTFAQQAEAYQSMSDSALAAGNAANEASAGATGAGILSGVGGVLAIGAMFL